MRILYKSKKQFELENGSLVKIRCGKMADISRSLIDLLNEAEIVLGKPLLFSEANNCPDVPNDVFVMTMRSNGYWIFLDMDKAKESDIAHEVIEAMLESEGELHITAQNMTHDFKQIFNLLESLIRDYEVDRRLVSRGFNDDEAKKRDIRLQVACFDSEGQITPGREKFYAMKKAIVAAACLVKDRRVTLSMPERKTLMSKLTAKSPDAYHLQEEIRVILDNADNSTPKSRSELVIKLWNLVFDPYLKRD